MPFYRNDQVCYLVPYPWDVRIASITLLIVKKYKYFL